ncbi:phasin family protein [Sphingomonas echinoides]|uniref:Phasin family protein n=1 Tax=Sphingomonas echinoides TaxID=59803 RepID=A0ABU4PQB0_9SPHN|nr:phasin family protein [Sphingomonas echinoides]MDX5985342.1 phasin family protein [Sphingomonas echinoides]
MVKRRAAPLFAASCVDAIGRYENGVAAEGNERMTDTASDAFKETITDPAQKAAESIREASTKIAENSASVGLKLLDQAETNTREAFAAMRAAASAKDLSEVMKIQGEFLREQGSRSMTQAREIGEVILQFGRDAVGAVRGDA